MRVLYMTNTMSGVSTNATLQGWLRLLRPRGLEPVVVTSERGPFERWLEQEGIPLYRFPLPRPDKRWPFPFLRSLARLWWIARRHRCQILHCNEHDLYPSVQFLARLGGYPILVGVRFTMEPEFSRYAFAGRRQPDRMLFVSQGNLNVCRSGLEGVVPESKWRVIYNGTDVDMYRPNPATREQFRKEHGLPPGVLVGAASALRPVKQLDHLFEAVSRLPDRTTSVVLAGGAVPELREYAAEIIARGRQLLGKRFIHLGHVTEMVGFLNAIDLFVSTSQAEGCSNSVLQALACGVPVIGYPSVSVDEQVLPGGGSIVEQDRVDLLAEELARYVASPELRQRASQGARARALELFDVRVIAEQVWREYEELLGDKGTTTRGAQTLTQSVAAGVK